MKPWPSRVGRNASTLVVLAVLALGIVVSCVSISTAATVPRDNGAASVAGASLRSPSATSSAATPTPGSSAVVAPTATPTAQPTVTPTLTPAPTPTPVASPTQAPATAAASRTARPGTAGTRSLDRATRRKLDRILANTVKNQGIAGLQAAVRMPNGERWLGTAGNAEFTPDRGVADDTVFSIASVTKTFIAALILQLAEEGKLSLDEPFGKYEPIAPRGNKATIRQLLSHTSGIYDYFGNPRYGRIAKAWLRQKSGPGLLSREHRWTYDEIMGLVKTGYCKVGECYRYSNTNFVILGKVAEAAGGAPLHKQLRRRFFKPLGMKNTVFQPAEQPPLDAAHGHWNIGAGYSDHTRSARIVPFMAAASVANAAGAIASTAEDLAIWADALYGGKVLSDASLKQMTKFLLPGTYGLGTDVASFAGNRAVGHRGGLRGFESSMWHFPRSGVSVVLLSNQGNWFTDVPMQKMVKAVLGER